MNTTKTKHIDAAEVAKMLRRHLKAEFPGTKFSVRTSKYSGGASVRVNWTDGPTDDDVSAVTELYEGADFDGMIDLKTHRLALAVEDGEPVEVRYGADFIFTERRTSDEFVAAAADFLRLNSGGTAGNDCGPCWSSGCYVAMNRDDPVWRARERYGWRLCCSPECAARVEITFGHIRPRRR